MIGGLVWCVSEGMDWIAFMLLSSRIGPARRWAENRVRNHWLVGPVAA